MGLVIDLSIEVPTCPSVVPGQRERGQSTQRRLQCQIVRVAHLNIERGQ